MSAGHNLLRCDGGERFPTKRPGPFVVQSDGHIVSANDPAVALLGGESRDNLVGRRLTEFIVSSDHQAFTRKLDRIRNGEAQGLGLAVSVERPDGDTRDVITLSSPVEWDGTTGVKTTLIDITVDDSHGLTTLRDQAIHEAPVGVAIADARQDDLPLVYVNDGFVELTGYCRDEVIGQNCRFLQGDETRDEPVAQMREAIAHEESVVVELRNYRKDGTMFWNRVTLSPVRNRGGEVTHYLGFQEDVSETKVFQHESTLFETQIVASGQAMLITDRDGTIEYVNPAFEEITGYPATEAVGQDPSILKSGEQDAQFYWELWGTITAGDVWQGTLWNQTKAGKYYQATETIVPVTNDRDEITNFVAIQTEVTHDAIRDEVLQVLDRVLRHNIRNSVTAISGFARALEEKVADPEALAMLERIGAAATELELISERTRPIFELFSGIYDPDPWAVTSLLDTIEASREIYDDAQITAECHISPEARVMGGRAVSIAVTEAIENAIVHTDQASPVVDITILARPDIPRLKIEIADSGPGIPSEEWEVVRSGVEQPLSHTSGIGLWLINWTITAIGGKVTVDENEPQGTVMTLDVPLEHATAEQTE